MMEQLKTGNIGIGNTSTLATLNNDRFIIVDQKEIFWKMRRRNAHAFRRGDSAKAEPEGRTSVRGASLKDTGRLTFAAAKMGAEVIPGLLESIRKAMSERREYGKGKKAARGSGTKAGVLRERITYVQIASWQLAKMYSGYIVAFT